MMSARRVRFAIEYPVDFNGAAAARRAGYAEDCAGQEANRLLKDVEVQAAIEQRKAELAAAAGVTPEWVLQQYRQMAMADPAELTRVERVNCRHCWGVGFEYQWTEREYRHAVDAAMASKELAVPPPCDGGFGFKKYGEPNPDCPECGGRGLEHVHVEDTRKLSTGAKRLFSGVKVTKDGIEIKQRSQDEALKVLAEFAGVSKKSVELAGPGGGAIPILTTPTEMTREQLLAIAASGSSS